MIAHAPATDASNFLMRIAQLQLGSAKTKAREASHHPPMQSVCRDVNPFWNRTLPRASEAVAHGV
jgi:hypothetical protein